MSNTAIDIETQILSGSAFYDASQMDTDWLGLTPWSKEYTIQKNLNKIMSLEY